MYWSTNLFKKNTIKQVATFTVATCLLASCNPSSNHQDEHINLEVDLPNFFKYEIDRLSKGNPSIEKTVSKDNATEKKSLQIKDWESELSSFSTIDLNKVAYKGSFTKDSLDSAITYTFNDDKLDLSQVKINYENHEIHKIEIHRHSNNLLYQTKENLYYEKGKEYRVEKEQKVWLLGISNYTITGKF